MPMAVQQEGTGIVGAIRADEDVAKLCIRHNLINLSEPVKCIEHSIAVSRRLVAAEVYHMGEQGA